MLLHFNASGNEFQVCLQRIAILKTKLGTQYLSSMLIGFYSVQVRLILGSLVLQFE